MLFKHISLALSVENYSLITDIQNYYSTGIKIDFSFKIEWVIQQFENGAANYQQASIKGGNETKKQTNAINKI